MAVFLADKTCAESDRTCRFRTVPGLGRLFDLVVAWNRRRRDWQLLAGLNERNLRDIGMDGGMLARDSAMSFWRLRCGQDLGSAAGRRSAKHRANEYPPL